MNFFGGGSGIRRLRGLFTMRLIKGAITSIHRGNKLNDRGSDEQVDFDGDKIKCLISSIDAG